jgi:mono/diheme cytochrome c family protein
MRAEALRIFAFALTLVLGCGACGRQGGPALSNEFGDGGVAFVGGIKCLQILSAEPLPPRSVVTNPASATATGDVYFTSVLFDQFNAFCGACHVSGSYGGWTVSKLTFAQQVTEAVIQRRIKTDNADSSSGQPTYMPPPGNPGAKPWSVRLADPNDPIVALVGLLEAWIQQGSPPGQFSLSPSPSPSTSPGSLSGSGDAGTAANDAALGVDAGGQPSAAVEADAATATSTATATAPAPAAAALPGAAAAQADYSLSPGIGARLTNIGTCVPNKYAVGINANTMDRLDAFFAQATALPPTLAETDLVTFDSQSLAENGVVSYVPAYPLWSDDAGKMRHVRPPRNQPIVFDQKTQQFRIPPNTRFYKTFVKKVIDGDGAEVYKKLETRLIVSRPDQTAADGTVTQTALFGTYIWDEAETKAVLLTDPLRDGKPFSDRVITYVLDEPRAAAIQASTPPTNNLEYALDTAIPPVRRHYGIPGSERCIQCHMGSPSAAFVLGFTPLQISTVPPGSGGVIEPATGDELTQLARLIDYKIVAGMTSPADVLPLESSQLPRTPRNSYELQAQAYLLGNCSHCHNPRGFPSTKAPELKNVLDFLPSATGGVFQFPLDRTSPVRARGVAHDVAIPYITPSLRDVPTAYSSSYTPKYRQCPGDGEAGTDGWCKTASMTPYVEFISAPWRSLIYRNVDTPFDYVDDLTIFPHMPMNTPGYDCRVAGILGDWMVSIPAVNPNAKREDDVSPSSGDRTPQPYVEVRPGDTGYATAQSDAKKRLDAYHAGHRYGFCPDTSDIIDPDVENGTLQTPADLPIYDNTATPPQMIMPADGVPNRPNWVVTDATDPPGDWLPRSSTWPQALVDHVADASGSGVPPADLQAVVNDLPSVTLDLNVRGTMLTEVPFGLWVDKPGCDLSGAPTAGSFQGADRPFWMDANNVPPGAHVYLEAPGAAVFNNICINCHGPQADAKGLLADEISIMTGGEARVANFRSGLFGPPASAGTPGANRLRVFGPSIATLGTDGGAPPDAQPDLQALADDFGARYLAWMALGGTKKRLPPTLLQIVSITPVLGQIRVGTTSRASANMLQLAQELCSNVLLSTINTGPTSFTGRALNWTLSTALIAKNGDAEMWLRLCSLNNRPVVRVLLPQLQTQAGAGSGSGSDGQAAASCSGLTIDPKSFYWGDAVGADGASVFAGATVMDQRGNLVAGIAPGNLQPTCVRSPTDPAQQAAVDAYLQGHPVEGDGGSNVIPRCPTALFAPATDGAGNLIQKWALKVGTDPSTGNLVYSDANTWALRGAINAGLAVFLYVDQLSKGLVTPKLGYNECDRMSLDAGP